MLRAYRFFTSKQNTIFDFLDHKTLSTINKSYLINASGACRGKSEKRPLVPPTYLAVQGGEDAYFLRHDGLGVADGVGGWAGVKNANPALYSLKLMHYSNQILQEYDDICVEPDVYANLTGKQVLQSSYDQVTQDATKESLVGSSTALVAVLRDDELRVANIGDCGIMVLRDGEPIFRSEEQQHEFNFPFQLGTLNRDTPNDAQTYQIKIREDDVIILGTDGLFDNMFDEEIIAIVNACARDPFKMSSKLLARARDLALDKHYASPFSLRANEQGFYYQGGKLDDITVVAGVIKLLEDSPDRR